MGQKKSSRILLLLSVLAAMPVTLCLVLFLVTCGGKNSESAGSSAIPKLVPLEKEFGLKWPTNAVFEHAATWEYTALLDGGSKNLETVARISISSSDFEKWRQVVTNELPQSEWYFVVVEPRLTNQYSWWDLHTIPAERVKRFGKRNEKSPSNIADMNVYVVESNAVATLYIQSHILSR